MDKLIELALSMYANEPCRLCGETITTDDVRTAVFVGYSSIFPGRSAHKSCWNRFKDIVEILVDE